LTALQSLNNNKNARVIPGVFICRRHFFAGGAIPNELRNGRKIEKTIEFNDTFKIYDSFMNLLNLLKN